MNNEHCPVCQEPELRETHDNGASRKCEHCNWFPGLYENEESFSEWIDHGVGD
ncbi:MAG: hypothetical protein HYY55_04425 [Candidatus Niyogibacteria bacterium]|nr:MAG: hypothetical protein HYY55_04425 [Candidatus Niyogibacteria bacterium]